MALKDTNPDDLMQAFTDIPDEMQQALLAFKPGVKEAAAEEHKRLLEGLKRMELKVILPIFTVYGVKWNKSDEADVKIFTWHNMPERKSAAWDMAVATGKHCHKVGLIGLVVCLQVETWMRMGTEEDVKSRKSIAGMPGNLDALMTIAMNLTRHFAIHTTLLERDAKGFLRPGKDLAFPGDGGEVGFFKEGKLGTVLQGFYFGMLESMRDSWVKRDEKKKWQ